MQKLDEFYLQKSKIIGEELFFEHTEGFDQALKDGFFYVKKPSYINLTPGDLFAQNFFKNKTHKAGKTHQYRGFNIFTPDIFGSMYEGYYVRDSDQTEQFFLEKEYWDRIYPREVQLMADQMHKFAVIILKNCLKRLNIPENLWFEGTGGATGYKGEYHLTFNHFRNVDAPRGLNIHKDSGWVTVLRSIKPGLEALISNKWYSISPKRGYFIVNFGCAMEIFTKNISSPVNAVTHRVRKISDINDRFSYALFVDNSTDETISKGLYSVDKDNKLYFEYNFNDFLQNILNNTYKKDGVGLY